MKGKYKEHDVHFPGPAPRCCTCGQDLVKTLDGFWLCPKIVWDRADAAARLKKPGVAPGGPADG